MQKQQECKRCGTCCKKGGPILHKDDLLLVPKGILSINHLVTIRQGELAFNPFNNRLEHSKHELLKIAGKAGGWECIFYDSAKSSCTIHQNRPLECRLLKCWDIHDIEQINGKEYLNRADIVEKNDPLREYMELAEEKCSYFEINSFLQKIRGQKQDQSILEQLTAILEQDLGIRNKAVYFYKLSLQSELFYFGRPMFQTVYSPHFQIKLEGTTLQVIRVAP
ncbi:MAG: YkgJ family cysteine cluster protein [Desulfobulbaceae bacterium]|nr:YkgJ family cysteine cluster protein [Desulfobulbaceae bacterium]